MISSIPFAMEKPLVVHTVHSYTDILIGGKKYSHWFMILSTRKVLPPLHFVNLS